MMSPSTEADGADATLDAPGVEPVQMQQTGLPNDTPVPGTPQIVLVDAGPATLEPPLATPKSDDDKNELGASKKSQSPQRDMAAALAPLTEKKSKSTSDGLLNSIDSFMSWGLGAMTKMEKMTMEAAETAYDATKNAATSTINSVGTFVVPKIASLKIVLSSIDPSAVNGMRIGLERVFGLSATLRAEHRKSGIAVQPVGIDAARKANENKIAATTPQSDEDTTVMTLSDRGNAVHLEVLSQGVPVSTEIVEALRERTVGVRGANTGEESSAAPCVHSDTGFAVTYDAMLREHKRKNSNGQGGVASSAEEGVKAALTSTSSDWHLTTCGLEYEQILVICSTVLLGKYRRCLVESAKAAAAAAKRGGDNPPLTEQPK